MINYYKVLGISPAATYEQVARAIRNYEARQLGKASAEQRALSKRAIYVLSDEQRRDAYDRVHGFNQGYESRLQLWQRTQEVFNCRQQIRQLEIELQWLRSQRLEVAILQQELIQCRQQRERLEVAQQRRRHELVHEQAVAEELAAKRHVRRRQYLYLAALILALALPGLVRSLFSAGPSVEEMFGRPYQPVAEGLRWGSSPDSAVQKQVELMPQFRGGAAGLRDYIGDQVLTQLPLAKAKPLLATGRLSFVVDSAGHIGPVRVLNVADSTSRQLLLAIGGRLPRFIPGFQEARPANVRLTVKLAE